MRPFFPFFLLLTLTLVKAQTNTDADIPINLPGAAPAATTTAPAATAPSTNTTTPAITPARQQALQNAIALRSAGELLGAGKADDALAKLNAVLQADPRNVSAYVLRGQIYAGKKAMDKATNDFQAAHLIDPKNMIVNFNLAEMKFIQKDYDGARAGFIEIQKAQTSDSSDFADLVGYKAFLCDLFGGHTDEAQKEYDAYNKAGEYASYYFANAAWSLYHHNIEDARQWLASASHIYAPRKNQIYGQSLFDLGYLPLPQPPAAH